MGDDLLDLIVEYPRLAAGIGNQHSVGDPQIQVLQDKYAQFII